MVVHLSENDTYKSKSAHQAIIEFLLENDVAGATVIRGIEGYGVHSVIHKTSILRLGMDLPIIVQAVDEEEKLRNTLPKLKKMIPDELIVMQDVEILAGDKRD
ncbi:DUF190 domain-containing protein [Methanohalophilus euhalobius]|uniref:DUF190 domain-containing protein n=1 Tax=Methanohalophilus euhalobius TaxID=51203 RepID=A0A314ZTI1_9EURY|nr:DUF190 domain-containing protein [Methanohalophilus euhalobius]PQV43185.1 hypothetical protein B0H22_103198 [Methanohalophilus euhalobius]RNI09255.1 DUF190 domain-containing protein [Methanohalophilus euhalobius]